MRPMPIFGCWTNIAGARLQFLTDTNISHLLTKKSSPTSVTNIADKDFQKSQKFEKQVSYIGNDAFNEIHFIYSIQRLPAFYVLNMIVPIFLMFFLSIFVFYLPTGLCSSTVKIYYVSLIIMSHCRYCADHEIEAFEKMTLSISILISQTVFLSLLAKRIPETSLDIPLLGGYLLFTMSMVSVRVVQAKFIHFPTDRVFILKDTRTRCK